MLLDRGDYLLRYLEEEGVLDAQGVEQIRAAAAAQGVDVAEAAASTALVSSHDLAVAKAALCEVAFVDLDAFDIDINNAQLLPRSVAERHKAFPLFNLDGVVTVAMRDPLNLRAIDQLRSFLRAEIDPVVCVEEKLGGLIGRAYSLVHAQDPSAAREEEEEARPGASDEQPIVAAVNQIISDAIRHRASDIHISPCETELQLRYRVDGELQSQQSPPLGSHGGLVQRLKVMAHLDLTQTRRPQDGKFRFTHRGEKYEVRLSIIPTVDGENVVMRLLRPNAQILGFEELGMNAGARESFGRVIESPNGMVLVTGPTGSGKTSTLYTALSVLNTPNRNIMTIEDPVEIRLAGVRQIQVNSEIGMTFAGALRSMLRQDPDVVLVGEIRDEETALIASQASLTGHLVLSTMHTNDASGAVSRLRNLGVPGFVVSASLLGVMAQRLVRRICTDCAAVCEPDPALARRFGVGQGDRVMRGGGGPRCSGAGFRGRTGIYELLPVTPEIAIQIEENAPAQQLQRTAREHGMKLMWEDGLEKALRGMTTLEEVAKAAATMDLGAEKGMRLSA